MNNEVIRINKLSFTINEQIIFNNLNFIVKQSDICALVGFSGTGKTTLLNFILGLNEYSIGEIFLFGENIKTSSNIKNIRQRIGVVFQSGALFTSLNVVENVSFPLQQFTDLPKNVCMNIAMLKLHQVGYKKTDIFKFPSELSGGMRKKASLARAIALDPKLLILDEPTVGLDPYSKKEIENLILSIHKNLGLTVVIISHDIELVQKISNKVAFMSKKHISHFASYDKVSSSSDSDVIKFFKGIRTIE